MTLAGLPIVGEDKSIGTETEYTTHGGETSVRAASVVDGALSDVITTGMII